MVGPGMAHHTSPGIALLVAPRGPGVGAQTTGGGVQGGAWLIAWFAVARDLWGEARKESGSEVKGILLRYVLRSFRLLLSRRSVRYLGPSMPMNPI